MLAHFVAPNGLWEVFQRGSEEESPLFTASRAQHPQMSRRSAHAKSTATLQSVDTINPASWDGSATTFGQWTQRVTTDVAAFDPALDTLATKGLASTSRGTVFINIRHMLLVTNRLDIMEYDWDDPSPADAETNLSATGTARASLDIPRGQRLH